MQIILYAKYICLSEVHMYVDIRMEMFVKVEMQVGNVGVSKSQRVGHLFAEKKTKELVKIFT